MKRVKYTTLVRPDTFIGQYMSYMSALETPSAYDFWTALWLTSLALGRGITVLRPRVPVYMNWYVILCAESGLTRKSTAVRMSADVARAYIERLGDDVEFIESKTTPETLEARLHKRSLEVGFAHVAISISELVRFLGRERYNMAMPGLLVDLYDCPDLQRGPGTLDRGPTAIKDVYITFMSASTPSWLARSVNPNVVEGGFTSRVIFVHAERRKQPVAWPEEDLTKHERQEALVGALFDMREAAHDVQKHHGGINLTVSALKYHKRWYNSRPEHLDTFRSTFEAREDDHVLRLAGCLAANDGGWMVERDHLIKATAVIAEVKERGARIFEGVMRSDSLVSGIEKMREVFMVAGTDTLTQTQLFLKLRSHFDKETFNITLSVLHELKMVQKFQREHDGKGPKTTFWRGTTLLMQQGAMELIVERFEQ